LLWISHLSDACKC